MSSRYSLLFLTIFTPLFTCAQGILFNTPSFNQALEEAKSTGKYIFVDVTATWCAPCKVMEREVFAKSEIGELMNTFFVNYQAVSDGAGKNFARQNNITAYPTLLFFSPSGKEVGRHLGFSDASVFIGMAEDVLGKTTYGPAYLAIKELWDKGERNPEMAMEYLNIRRSFGLDNDRVLQQFVESLPKDSVTAPSTAKVVAYHTYATHGYGYKYLLKHRDIRRCSQKINVLLKDLSNTAIAKYDTKLANQYVENLYETSVDTREADLKKHEFWCKFYLETKNTAAFIKYTDEVVPTLLQEIERATDSTHKASTAKLVENIGWQYAEFITDQPALESALAWLERLSAVAPNAFIWGYEATIAEKLGKIESKCAFLAKAIEWATAHQQATEIWSARQEGCD